MKNQTLKIGFLEMNMELEEELNKFERSFVQEMKL
jgi:hypothetical protein